MRRADRLFQIVQTLRGRRLTTAAHVAQRLEVSERTANRDAADRPSERTLRPLGVFYWGAVWRPTAWCELRENSRSLRIDRIETLDVLPRPFSDAPSRTLADLLRHIKTQPHRTR